MHFHQYTISARAKQRMVNRKGLQTSFEICRPILKTHKKNNNGGTLGVFARKRGLNHPLDMQGKVSDFIVLERRVGNLL